MSDEGFHEFQLNGKQLVFLFMTCTVVAVVIFLCGVMVGRNLPANRSVQTLQASADVEGDPTASAQGVVAAPAAPTEGASPSAQETLTYPDRLEDPTPPPETLQDPTAPASTSRQETRPAPPQPARAAAQPAPAPPPPVQERAPEKGKTPPAAAPPPAARSEPLASEPAGNGFVVQVAAVKERREAETIARRLAAKGYPSFITTPAGAAHVFRVRIGKYSDRHQAETIKARLEKEEQFKPWITR